MPAPRIVLGWLFGGSSAEPKVAPARMPRIRHRGPPFYPVPGPPVVPPPAPCPAILPLFACGQGGATLRRRIAVTDRGGHVPPVDGIAAQPFIAPAVPGGSGGGGVPGQRLGHSEVGPGVEQVPDEGPLPETMPSACDRPRGRGVTTCIVYLPDDERTARALAGLACQGVRQKSGGFGSWLVRAIV